MRKTTGLDFNPEVLNYNNMSSPWYIIRLYDGMTYYYSV